MNYKLEAQAQLAQSENSMAKVPSAVRGDEIQGESSVERRVILGTEFELDTEASSALTEQRGRGHWPQRKSGRLPPRRRPIYYEEKEGSRSSVSNMQACSKLASQMTE